MKWHEWEIIHGCIRTVEKFPQQTHDGRIIYVQKYIAMNVGSYAKEIVNMHNSTVPHEPVWENDLFESLII